jgi:hypothetical protein
VEQNGTYCLVIGGSHGSSLHSFTWRPKIKLSPTVRAAQPALAIFITKR